MLIKTLLNHCYKIKSFVYGKCEIIREKEGDVLLVHIAARRNNKPKCAGCGRESAGYDRLPVRRWEFIPFWGLRVFFVYAKRRVKCPDCGVREESVPWGGGKSRSTVAHQLFLAHWGKTLSWQEVSERFHCGWRKVAEAVSFVVNWGLSKRDLSGVTAIGIDEISIKKGHKYVTLVYQINEGIKRLLWVGENREIKTLLRFSHDMGRDFLKGIKFVCSDMWKPYLKVIAKRMPRALHILDRFHIVQKMNKAIDEIRAAEHRALKQKKEEPLKKARWCLLKRKENLTEKQEAKLSDLLKLNLKSIRAYLLKEDFQGLWDYVRAGWAGRFIDRWTKRVMYSRLEPMKKFAKTVREHKPLILNWFRAKGQVSTGAVEGLNNRIKVTVKKSYGFRTYDTLKIALYHALGDLPEPELTHKLW